ncbi:LruC domain-containing protein [Marinobacter hydrocarbonoclasticus]|nr:LruC domain-containing protein [Marinobacter nauticus]
MRPMLLIACLFPLPMLAQPLDECPAEAFLFQQSQTVVYGVDLFTGATSQLAASTGLDGTINAVGFNETDRYLYGFHKQSLDVVRVDRDFQAQTLGVTGLPSGKHFYVGDVHNNTYWVYLKGTGLYAINLDASAPDYLQASQVVGADVSMSLTDFAFHPSDGYLYAVGNNNGSLYRIDVSDGSKTTIANIGVTGTFGAGYFEKTGYYFVSRNSDGNIYRIDLRDPAAVEDGATLYAYGPSSGQNDGARCASAPIVASNTDFGDAPDSYGTTIDSNGARHGLLNSGLSLGALVDEDSDGATGANLDDTVGVDDEDGVLILGTIESGLDTLIQVDVVGQAGYLQGFFDWNRDGDFLDEGEKAIDDRYLDVGRHYLLVRGPDTLDEGASYARFRLSTQAGLGPTGGAGDGEVEDHPIELATVPLGYTYYPNAGGWATLAFEDHWPRQADYDMNDLVMAIRVTEIRRDNQLIRIDLTGQLLAAGAAYQNGFGWHLSGIPASAIDQDRIRHRVNGAVASNSGVLEAGRQDAIIQVFSNSKSVVNSSCTYFRTQSDCQDGVQYQFEISVPMRSGLADAEVPQMPYNPFLFATPGTYRQGFDDAPGRGLEIHLADHPPTEAANPQFFGREADRTQPGSTTYRNDNSLPWALLLPEAWSHPKERVDLLLAYPDFAPYVQSDGLNHQDWSATANGVAQHLYQESQ